MSIKKVYDNLPSLETERLILRKITFEDIEDMYAYASNEQVTKYVTWNTHQTLSDTKEFVEFILNQYKEKKIALWGIVYKENGKLIGTIDFVQWLPGQKIAEIGYAISQDYWSKGIMTEAVKEIIEFGFAKMELVRIQARCLVENISSARVMEKAGMSFEGIIRKGIFVKGEHRDLKMYSILRDEFLSVSSIL